MADLLNAIAWRDVWLRQSSQPGGLSAVCPLTAQRWVDWGARRLHEPNPSTAGKVLAVSPASDGRTVNGRRCRTRVGRGMLGGVEAFLRGAIERSQICTLSAPFTFSSVSRSGYGAPWIVAQPARLAGCYNSHPSTVRRRPSPPRFPKGGGSRRGEGGSSSASTTWTSPASALSLRTV